MKILIINGPNLNFLGIREKDVYGTQDYDCLLRMIAEKGEREQCQIEVFQSNHEGAIIDRIQDAYFDNARISSATCGVFFPSTHITSSAALRYRSSRSCRSVFIFPIGSSPCSRGLVTSPFKRS